MSTVGAKRGNPAQDSLTYRPREKGAEGDVKGGGGGERESESGLSPIGVITAVVPAPSRWCKALIKEEVQECHSLCSADWGVQRSGLFRYRRKLSRSDDW